MKFTTLPNPFMALLCLAVTALLSACGGTDTPDPTLYNKSGHFLKPHLYTNEKPGTQTRCAEPEGCISYLRFEPDGSGTVILSDIANRVSYSVKNNVLTTTLIGSGDIPKTMKYDVLEKAQTLVGQDSGVMYYLKPEPVAVYQATGAIACEPDTGISISQSVQLLADKDISSQSSYCGYLANIARPAVCGIPTDKVYVHLIAPDQVATAQKLGFSLANKDTASQVTQTPCPTN
jgi:hypothetical protein